MSLEDLGFKRLISSPSSLVGAVSASPSGWVWGGLGAALAGVLGAAVYYRKTTPEYEATLDRVAKLLGKPRAVLDTEASPEILRLAKKGVTAEAIAFGVRAMARSIEDEDGTHVPIASEVAAQVMEIEKAVSRVPERERARLVIANALNKKMIDRREIGYFGWDPRAPLAPQYPFLKEEDAARVVAEGVSPKKIFEPVPWEVVVANAGAPPTDEPFTGIRAGIDDYAAQDRENLQRRMGTQKDRFFVRPAKSISTDRAKPSRADAAAAELDDLYNRLEAVPEEDEALRQTLRGELRAKRAVVRELRRGERKKTMKLSKFEVPRLRSGSRSYRGDYLTAECEPLITKAWNDLPRDEKILIALERHQLKIGKPPADYVEPPEGDRRAARWFKDVESALAWAEGVKAGHERTTEKPYTVADLVRDTADTVSTDLPVELATQSPEGAKWLLSTCKDPVRLAALVKPRTFPSEDGGGRYYSNYANELDDREVPNALMANPKRSIDEVWRASISRDDSEALKKFGDKLLYRAPNWWPKDLAGVEVLNRATDMVAEGKAMRHCLGHSNQIYAAKEGRALYGSITAPDGARGTFEIKPDGTLIQLRGPHNAKPEPSVEAIFRRVQGSSPRGNGWKL